MRRSSWLAGCITLLATCVLSLRGSAAELPAEEAHEEAAKLVASALSFELDGDTKYRDLVLQLALHTAPDYGPARWHSGQVRIDGSWLTLDEISRRTQNDRRLEQYRALREKTAEFALAQLELARWCEKNELDDEARFHWRKVLQLGRDNDVLAVREASQKLGLQTYAGMLLTPEQIRQRTEEARQAQLAMDHWRPILFGLRREIGSSDASVSAAALRRLREIPIPTALPALEAVFSEHSQKSALEVVAILGQTEHPQATQSLVRHALLAKWDKVRQAATDPLKNRPWDGFVPLLLDSLASPLEVRTGAVLHPNGVLEYQQSWFREGPLENYLFETKLTAVRTQAWENQRTRNRDAMVLAQAVQGSTSLAARNVQNVNRTTAQFNDRIYAVLTQTTGVDLPSAPHPWWQWWQDYNEVQANQDKPLRYAFTSFQQAYSTQPVGQPAIQLNGNQFNGGSQSRECFPRGTKVWTLEGLAAIERIEAGDRVLSRHPETGELTYKTVLATTVRPPSPMVQLGLAGEELTATLGHPLWVAGEGWRMAKHLQAGNRVHGLQGSTTIDTIQKVDDDVAYNLIVDDFHTYFVGQTGVMVHDGTFRGPTQSLIPGLVAR